MLALILCPGPSLARLAELPAHDVLLAVNTALSHPLAAGADWWVALDVWRKPLPAHRPRSGMVTCQAAIDEGQAELVPYPLIDYRQHRRARAVATTLPAALWWAAHLGADEVEVLGCDMTPAPDFLGEEGWNRGVDRWARERRDCFDAADRTGMRVRGIQWPR